MSRGDVILRLVELTKVYTGKTTVKALNNISTSFKRGEFVAVVGRSGSGKSTLINILGGLDRPSKGDYYCEGNNVSRLNEGHWDALRNKKIGFIFQNYFLIEYLTIYQNVEVALQFQNVPQAMKDAKIKGIIEKVGLIDHIDKYPSQLSGGQRQRVAIARALVKDPDIILADEPTGALDWKTADEIIKLLKGESEDRLVVMVTHDRKIANKYANRIIEIENGEFKHDLIKEEIEQTYQNVFRKIQPVNLKKKDKFMMTFNKIKSNLVRNFFISLSLALAFSFTIIFNGLDRGVRDSYHSYYETLSNTYSNSFSVISNKEGLSSNDFNYSNSRIKDALARDFNVLQANSKDVVIVDRMVKNVNFEEQYTDLTTESKVRLIDSDFYRYEHDKLFITNSSYPEYNNSVMVSSKFIRDYFKLNSNEEVSAYINRAIKLPRYQFESKDKLNDVVLDLNSITISETGEFYLGNFGKYPVKYATIKIPQYCYYQDQLDSYFDSKCDSYFKEDPLFASKEDYIEYMDYFINIVNLIDPNYYDLLERSNAVFYFEDLNTINKVYNLLYMNRKISNEVFVNTETKVSFTISGIVDNRSESIIYLTKDNYNNLFKKSDSRIQFVNGFYTVSHHADDENRENFFGNIKSYRDEQIALISNDYAESIASCDVEAITDYKTKEYSIFQDIFYYINYQSCGTEQAASSYLSMLNILFSTFFNILMVASIIFYSMLIRVIFKARINEIGVFRSVGSTIKDIKRLFFYEVLFIFTTATILCGVIIVVLNTVSNSLFLSLTSVETNVIHIANINFLLNESSSIINISFINLIVQIVIVVSIILFNSNRSITQIVNTNPIDILREVV